MFRSSIRDNFNIYCDESCHMLNDHQSSMVLGAVWCEQAKVRDISSRVKDIKQKHGIPAYTELKWSKVSPSKVEMYRDLVDYFFDDDDLHFRSLIIPDKSLLRHDKFDQDHDTWYFKMYFQLLKTIIISENRYYIYLDIKDTRSSQKTAMLGEVLAHQNYDFNRNIIKRIQSIRSEESQILQLADLLIGVMSAVSRDSARSESKNQIIERVRRRSGLSLTSSTWPSEPKFNVFRWRAQNIDIDS